MTGYADRYTWSFGDGSPYAYTQNATHTYTSSGTYTVTFLAMNPVEASTATATVVVSSGLQAAFSVYPQSGPAPLAVWFLDYSAGPPSSWSWSFGDGTTSVEREPTHVYAAPGHYTVTLTVTDRDGRTDTAALLQGIVVTAPGRPTMTITLASAPVANFTANTTVGPAPMTVQFAESSSPTPYHRWWRFGDGSSSTDANPVHTYAKAGTYTVNLTVWTGIGTAATEKSGYITVGPDPRSPVANFTMSRTSGVAPLFIRFTDLSTGGPSSWRWDFGGIAWTTAKSPAVVFRRAGTYAITLTTINAYGSSTVTWNLNVTAPPFSNRSPAAVEGPVQIVG